MSITQEELGRRIRTARETCGLTQEALGQQIGLSRSAIVQIEQGHRAVSSLELDRIAYVLGRDIRAFFGREFNEQDALAILFRSQPEFVSQPEIIEALRHRLALGREMTNLERLLGIDRTQLRAAAYDLPAIRSRWDAIQLGEHVAMEERHRLGLGTVPVGDLTDLLESQGVRTGQVDLPDDVRGLTLNDSRVGLFVVVNRRHAPWRRRFSLVHEYAHVLMDRVRPATVSRTHNHNELIEIRANAFAAEFLMPDEGVRQFIAALGKGRPSRRAVTVFDESVPLSVESRAEPGSQDVQIYDVALLAHHFGVSRPSALYRLWNLRLIDEPAFQGLKAEEEAGRGRVVADFFDLPEPDHQAARDEVRRRLLGLALEAYRREEITCSKLCELAAMVDVPRERIENMLENAGLETSKAPQPA